MRKFNPIMKKVKNAQHFPLLSFFHLWISDVPVVSLEFGTNQQSISSGIKEGADVYFECNIKANPWVYKVNWKQNVSFSFLLLCFWNYLFKWLFCRYCIFHHSVYPILCWNLWQNKDLTFTSNEGLLISNQSLVITNVKRAQMGQYTCSASNSEGEGESNPILLEIQCKWERGGNLWDNSHLITLAFYNLL